MIVCKEDDSREEETEYESIYNPTYEEVWKTIKNLKTKKNAIGVHRW